MKELMMIFRVEDAEGRAIIDDQQVTITLGDLTFPEIARDHIAEAAAALKSQNGPLALDRMREQNRLEEAVSAAAVAAQRFILIRLREWARRSAGTS